MPSFFSDGDFPDPIYCAARDGNGPLHLQGQQHLEHIWRECAAYVDPDAKEKATREFASVFWELQLAYALKSAGKTIVPRDRLAYKDNKGPDLFVSNPDV